MSDTSHFHVLAWFLGWQDVKDTYQRSTLGPLWITLGLGVQITAIGLVFGLLFGTDLSEYFPFLAISLILWTFLVSTITDSTAAYVHSDRIMKQIYVPAFFPVVRTLAKNVVILAHNLVIVGIVLAVFQVVPGWSAVLFIPGVMVVGGVVYAVSTVAATVSARFRDVPPIVASLLTLSFYVTPIIWLPDSLPEQIRGVILTVNPFFHLMELIREPLMGGMASALNWLVSLGVLAGTGLFAVWVSRRYAWKIVYWL